MVYWRIKKIKREWFGTIFELEDCAPYKFLNGDTDEYSKYVEFHVNNNLPIMSEERFNNLIESIEKKGYDFRYPIILDKNNNAVLDGQHRVCYLLKKYGKKFKVPVIRIEFINIDLRQIKPFSKKIY